ncbi:MAG: hypothetical protein U1E10_09045 [Bdellovibrionales bacterium]|nr:hypothetical protein [Bdellovibrionales bacterium]
MLAAKKTGLLPILNSKNGFHFTGYISNDHNVASVEKKLRRLIDETYEYLQPVMETDRLSKFLEPIEALLQNVSSLSEMQGNIGIFRNESSLRVICLPILVEDTFVVATSFHVKPLLKWLQVERDFHLLTFDGTLAYLFKGDSNSFIQISTFQFGEGVEHDDGTRLLHWLRTYRGSTAPDLFVMGSSDLLEARLSKGGRRSLFADVVLSFDLPFSKASLEKTCVEIRSVFAQRAKADLQKSLIEFSIAEDQSRIAKNIFQISKAVARGEVRKLMVAADAKVFGKIDPKTGGLAINPYHLDHEDDDILDDLAQAVIAQGGEVIVAAEGEMPRARIAMAILKSELRIRTEDDMENL